MRSRSFPSLAVLVLLPALLVGGCTPPGWIAYPPQTRGEKIDPDALQQLTPGISKRADVLAALGSPTDRASFDDNTWLYISEVTRPEIGGTLAVLSQEVYVVSFNQDGVLTSVQKKTKADAVPVTMVARTTPAPGTNATILQQLLGNVGRFSAGPTPGSGGIGGGTNPGNF